MERIEKLLKENEFEKAMELLKEVEMNHYDKVYFEAKALIGLSKFDEALDLVAEELKMPYIPMEHDRKFNELFDQIIIAKRQMAQTGLNQYSIEQVAQIIQDEEDFETVIHAILQLKDYNIRKIMDQIETFLKDESKNSIAKTFLIELMHNQGVDKKVVVTKNGNGETINPMDIVPVLESDILAITSSHLEKNMAKDPSKLEFCYQSLDNLLFDLFPFMPEIKDAKSIAWAVESYVCSLFGEEAPIPAGDIDISVAKKFIDKLVSY